MKYHYQATQLKTENIDGFKNVVVTFVGYLYGIDENGKNTTVFFEFDFDKELLNEKSFVEYKDLTEDLITDWVEKQMTEVEQKQLEQDLNKKIANFYTDFKRESTSLPWA